MSEYLNKKAVLESIGEAYQTNLESPDQTDWDEVRFMKRTVLSGAFDAPEMEHINTYWAREGLIKHQEAEVQHLRAALEMAQSELRWGDPTNAIERVERIIDEALSTTTEPTNAAKVKRVREGDGNDA